MIDGVLGSIAIVISIVALYFTYQQTKIARQSALIERRLDAFMIYYKYFKCVYDAKKNISFDIKSGDDSQFIGSLCLLCDGMPLRFTSKMYFEVVNAECFLRCIGYHKYACFLSSYAHLIGLIRLCLDDFKNDKPVNDTYRKNIIELFDDEISPIVDDEMFHKLQNEIPKDLLSKEFI